MSSDLVITIREQHAEKGDPEVSLLVDPFLVSRCTHPEEVIGHQILHSIEVLEEELKK